MGFFDIMPFWKGPETPFFPFRPAAPVPLACFAFFPWTPVQPPLMT
jgi:hypothetical protein